MIPANIKPFVGVDGEGGRRFISSSDGEVKIDHVYLLLRAGEYSLETGRPLGCFECLDFLATLPQGVIYVAFFFDYDVTMILRDLPMGRLKRLLDENVRKIPGKPCMSFPLDIGWWYQIDYLSRKEFKVRKRKERSEERRVGKEC